MSSSAPQRHRIFVLRHGLPEPHDSLRYPDGDRALSPVGAAQVKQLIEEARDWLLPLNGLWHSPLLRTTETAAIVCDVLGPAAPSMQPTHALLEHLSRYECEQKLPALIAQNGMLLDGVLLVGHQPSLTQIVSVLTGAPTLSIALHPGTLIELGVWQEQQRLRGAVVRTAHVS